ncbi:MAG: TIGR02444 family protein [Pseudomonadota bacterium]
MNGPALESIAHQDESRAHIVGDFWNWSIEFYKLPGVPAVLIELQDTAGANVNCLLWALWMSSRTAKIDADTVRLAIESSSAISEQITQPIRATRRAAKSLNNHLYQELKATELSAEAQEQRSIILSIVDEYGISYFGAAATSTRPNSANVRLAEENIELVMTGLSIPDNIRKSSRDQLIRAYEMGDVVKHAGP